MSCSKDAKDTNISTDFTTGRDRSQKLQAASALLTCTAATSQLTRVQRASRKATRVPSSRSCTWTLEQRKRAADGAQARVAADKNAAHAAARRRECEQRRQHNLRHHPGSAVGAVRLKQARRGVGCILGQSTRTAPSSQANCCTINSAWQTPPPQRRVSDHRVQRQRVLRARRTRAHHGRAQHIMGGQNKMHRAKEGTLP